MGTDDLGVWPRVWLFKNPVPGSVVAPAQSERKCMMMLMSFLIWQDGSGHTIASGPEPSLLTHRLTILFCFLMRN